MDEHTSPHFPSPYTTYQQKLLDPRWQRKRLEILQRDNWTCQACLDTEHTLHVHHRYYQKDKNPWEYPPQSLVTLCAECHEKETNTRGTMEITLLNALNDAGFLSEDVFELAVAFAIKKNQFPPLVTAYFLQHLLHNPESMEKSMSEYFQWLTNNGKHETLAIFQKYIEQKGAAL
jgi:hypothetical protein